MLDETPPEVESDLRRRAAWLLGMLAVVVALLLFVMTQVLGGGSSNNKGNGGPRPLDSYVNGQTSRHASSTPPTHSASHPSTRASATTSASTPPVGGTSCPTQTTCVLTGDVGQGVAAVNAYRSTHGQPAVPGSVGPEAQQCALHNGNGCSGGWAETELAKPDGTQAVQKIQSFGHLLDPNTKSFEVGWAYDPGAKLYYFAIIRHD